MPTYVYKFIETGETIEVMQSFDDPTLTEAVHPTTGATMPVKKVFLPVGVTFKGDGFYKTDSRSQSKKSSGSSSSESSNGSSSNDSTSSGGSSETSKSPAPSTASSSSSSTASSSSSSSD